MLGPREPSGLWGLETFGGRTEIRRGLVGRGERSREVGGAAGLGSTPLGEEGQDVRDS